MNRVLTFVALAAAPTLANPEITVARASLSQEESDTVSEPQPTEYAGAPGLRRDIKAMLNPLDRDGELKWGRIAGLAADERAAEIARIAGDYGLRQVEVDARLLWLNGEDKVEAMFCFVPEPRELAPFLEIYRLIDRLDYPLNFLIHPQLGREDTFDAYCLSRASYMEHSWELGLKGDGEEPPLDERLRADLYDLFRLRAAVPTPALAEAEKSRWWWALSSSDYATFAKLAREAAAHGCQQELDGEFALWRDAQGKLQAIFARVKDPTTPAPFRRIYEKVEQTGCPLTYVFVEQLADGPGNWDIFRLAPQFSYLSHNWRFWPGQQLAALPEETAKVGGTTYTFRWVAPDRLAAAPLHGMGTCELRAPHSGRPAVYDAHVDPLYNIHCQLQPGWTMAKVDEARGARDWDEYWRDLAAGLADKIAHFALVAYAEGRQAGQVRFFPGGLAQLDRAPEGPHRRAGDEVLLVGAGAVDLAGADDGLDAELLQRVVAYARDEGYAGVRGLGWSNVGPYAMWGEQLPLAAYEAAGFGRVEAFDADRNDAFKDMLAGSQGADVQKIVTDALGGGMTEEEAHTRYIMEVDLNSRADDTGGW